MKTLIQLIVVALIAGGISAAGTIFWQKQFGTPTVAASATPAVDSKDKDPKKEAQEKAANVDPDAEPLVLSDADRELLESTRVKKPVTSDPKSPVVADPADPVQIAKREAPSGIKPPYDPDGDEAGELINKFHDRAKLAAEKERKINERLSVLKILFDDVHAEKVETLKVRRELKKELELARKALDTTLQEVDAERNAMRAQQEEERKAAEEKLRAATEENEKLRKQQEKATTTSPEVADGSSVPFSTVDNLKKTAQTLDIMPAEKTTEIFQKLVKDKQIDVVVLMLNAMKLKKASEVLSKIGDTDPQLAADLTLRLRRLKPAPVPVSGE